MLLVERVEHHYVRAVSIAVINDYEIEWGNAFNIRFQSCNEYENRGQKFDLM